MRTKAQVALTALEQALKITGVQEPKRDDEFTAGRVRRQGRDAHGGS
jgi:hypothetical protein